MKLSTNKSKSRRKSVVTLLVIALVVILGYLAMAFYAHFWPFQQPSSQASQVSEDQVSDKNKQLPVNPDQSKTATDSSDPKAIIPSADPLPAGESPEKPTVTASFRNDSIRVSAMLSKASDGSCELTLKKDGAIVTRTASVVVAPSYYTCNGFRVPKSELSTGNWSVIVTHIRGDARTDSDTKEVTVN